MLSRQSGAHIDLYCSHLLTDCGALLTGSSASVKPSAGRHRALGHVWLALQGPYTPANVKDNYQ